MRDQKKQGILISYVNILLSTLINVVLTPMLIGALTDEGYSVYKIMHSFAGPLAMLNLGVSTVVARNVAKFLATKDGDRKEKENTYALGLIISAAMCGLIVLAGYVMQLYIPTIYKDSFTPENILMAQRMFMVFTTTTAIHILTEPFRGVIMGYGRFVVYYGSQTLQYIFRFSAIFILLKLGHDALSVALVDLVLAIVILLSYIVYDFFVLHQRIKLHYFDKQNLIEFALFAVAILLQAFVNQVNNNLDIIILGASQVAEVITMYSSALMIYSVYNMLISVFSGVYLPQATKLVHQGAGGEQLTDFIIKPGRIQAVIALAVLGGFAVAGQDFITVWIGAKYINAYWVALLLMIPVTIPLVESVGIAILDAKLKRVFRSVTLMIMAVINAGLTIVFVQFWGFWGALAGTVISLLVGHGLLMNIYYRKALKINVIRMFGGIFSRTLLAGLLSVAVCLPISLFINGTVLAFLVKGVCFVIVYAACLLLFALNKEEKQYFLHFFRKQ